MIETVADALLEKGLEADALHAERFGVPGKGSRAAAPLIEVGADSVAVTVILDGHKKSFAMPRTGTNIGTRPGTAVFLQGRYLRDLSHLRT